MLLAALAAAAYFASARLGYAFAIGSGTVTLWPPSGVMLGLLLLNRKRDWPLLLAGGVSGSLLSDLLSGYSLPLAVGAALANGLETVVAAWLVVWRLGTPVTLGSLRSVATLTLGAAVLSNAVTAIAGALMLHAGFHVPLARAWFMWWAGDGLGMLVFAPVLLTWADAARTWKPRKPLDILEAAALLVVLTVAGRIALGPQHGWVSEPYITFPLVFWAALRFGPVGAATGTLVLAGIATWYAALGVGAFAAMGATASDATLRVYAYLGLASFSSLIAASVLEERKAALDELRQGRKRYRTVVETATDAIITIDRDSRIQYANPATERIFGYTPQELRGLDLTMLMPARLREKHKAGMARYLATGQKNIAWQGTPLTGLHRNGQEVPLEVSFGGLAENNRHEFTGILRDTSERQAAERAIGVLEEQYRQSQKMEAIGQLAGGVAHDFNNLLTIIQGYGEFLVADLGSDNKHQADLAQMLRAAEHAAALTRQLLAFSRRTTLEPRVLDLSESLRAIEPMLRRLIGEHVTFIVRAPADAGRVTADPGQIEQVILNLAVNARDAMPEGGTLLVELANVVLDESYARAHVDVTPGRYVMLSVSDTGVGMDAATAARVFEPFFSTKPKDKGTGLGLSTVHGIVKQSGGSIWVDSEPGRGSTFKVYLPHVDAPADAPAPHGTFAAPHGTETVLLVEDEESVRRLAQRILEQHGYRVLSAASPRKALAILAAHNGPIDLLLSDVIMPGMSGKALAERVLSTNPVLRVLYMSGYTDDAIGHQGVLDPGTAFIQKPFTPDALLRKVREVVEAHNGS